MKFVDFRVRNPVCVAENICPEFTTATRKIHFRYNILCGCVFDAVDAVRSSIAEKNGGAIKFIPMIICPRKENFKYKKLFYYRLNKTIVIIIIVIIIVVVIVVVVVIVRCFIIIGSDCTVDKHFAFIHICPSCF